MSDFIFPTYGNDSLINVLPIVAKRLHDDDAAKSVVIVLCDGLGWHNLEARKAHAPFLRQHLAAMQRLTTTFPSTTAAALPSFGTGLPPGQTGFVGYTARNPANGALVNLVPWTEVKNPAIIATPVGNSQSPKFKTSPTTFQPHPAIFSTLQNQGVTVTSVGSAKFAGSGLSLAAFGKTNYAVTELPNDRIAATLRLLRNPPGSKKQLVYLYWGDLDKVGHSAGPDSPEWAGVLTDFDAAFAQLVQGSPPGTMIVLTADHGQVEVDPAQQIDVASVPALQDGVALVAGEARAAHVYLSSLSSANFAAHGVTPADLEAAAARWQNYLGERAQVWSGQQAIEMELFGSVRAEVEPWIGDLVVAAKGQTTIVDSRTQTTNSLTLKGVHGSLTPQEMEIPLLVISC